MKDKIARSADQTDRQSAFHHNEEPAALDHALAHAKHHSQRAMRAAADDYLIRLGRFTHAARVGWETGELESCPFCHSGFSTVSMPGEVDPMEDDQLYWNLGRVAYESFYRLGQK